VWAVLPHDGVVAARASLGSSPLELSRWFFGGVLPRALFPLSLRPLPALAGCLGVLLVIGLILASRGRTHRPLLRTGLLLSLIPLAHLASIAAGPDLRPTYRSMVALAPVIMVLLLHAAEGWTSMLRAGGAAARVLPAMALVVPLVLAVEAPLVTYTYIAHPHAIEYDVAKDATSSIPPQVPIIVMTTKTDTLIARTRFTDEFGHPTSWYPWAVGPIVRLARHDTSGSWGAPIRWRERGTTVPAGAVLVDFDVLLRTRDSGDR
jgi:hypothetical protein